MATLATYFELGKQTHRSLDDVRMDLKVLKYCSATVLFLVTFPLAILVPHGSQQHMKLKSYSIEIPLCSSTILVCKYGLEMIGKFLDNAGRRRLNFMVDLYSSLCSILEACDSNARKLSVDSGSTSEWVHDGESSERICKLLPYRKDTYTDRDKWRCSSSVCNRGSTPERESSEDKILRS